MSVHKVKCAIECHDNKTSQHYWIGQDYKVESTSPIAKYFEGWPIGTEIYYKRPVERNGKIVLEKGTEIVGGNPQPIIQPLQSQPEAAPELILQPNKPSTQTMRPASHHAINKSKRKPGRPLVSRVTDPPNSTVEKIDGV